MPKKPTKKQLTSMLPPNDPRRVPKEHQQLVVDIYNTIKDAGLDIFQAQIITQAISILARGQDLLGAATVVVDIVKKITSVKDAQVHTEAILQLLGMKMNEAFNKMKLSDFNIDTEVK